MRDSDGCCVEIPKLDTATSSEGNAGTGPRTSSGGASVTIPRPSVIPDCIRVVGGSYLYCPPSRCEAPVKPTPTSAPRTNAWEEAVIRLNNLNGAPFQLRARRPVGTQQWQEWAARPMQPMGNEWIESSLAYTPIGAGEIVEGAAMTPQTFETMRQQQQSPIYPSATVGLGSIMLPSMDGSGSTDNASTDSASPDGSVTTPDRSTVMHQSMQGEAPCTFMYEARFSPDPYDRWFANIGGQWVEIVACCPKPSVDACCTESVAILKATQRDMQRLLELVMRLGQGEPLDVSDLRSDLSVVKQTLATLQTTRYDDTQMLTRLSALEQAVRAIRMPQAYDDAAVRRDIAEVRQLIETRSSSEGCQNYDRRFDALESLVRSIVIPPAVVTDQGVTVSGPDHTPLLLEIQRSIAELRTAPSIDFDRRLHELKLTMERLASTCPTCSEQHMAELRSRLAAIEQNTSRNYDGQFAELRSMLQEILTTGTSATDERLTRLEQLVTSIRDRESKDYTESFARLETLIADLRVAAGRERSYDQWFEAIVSRLDALRLPSEGDNHDYRWENVQRLLTEIRERVTTDAAESSTIDNGENLRRLTEAITQATDRVVLHADRRYDDLRMVIDGLRTILAVRGDAAPVEPDDDRLREILLVLDALQTQTSTMVSSLDQARRDVAALSTMQARMETAFQREITSLQQVIRTAGGDAETYEALRQAQEDLTYQRNRYQADIDVLQRRLAACTTWTPPSQRQDVSAAETETYERQHQGRVIDVVRSDAPVRTTPSSDCPDCPAMIERHERVYYRFPSVPLSPAEDQPCDDEPCDN
ncbi:MAG: hypothetical protein FGM24_09900 [Candidatus Kapabacteria bacterium]|nr:hypothetical protein [Candidatus Kapabacteria bacterium]